MANEVSFHVGRMWKGNRIEQTCPCPKEPCGLVDTAKADPECVQHTAMRTMRQMHNAKNCPAKEHTS